MKNLYQIIFDDIEYYLELDIDELDRIQNGKYLELDFIV